MTNVVALKDEADWGESIPYDQVPNVKLVEELRLWVKHGVRPTSMFLWALICNDLHGTWIFGTEADRANLPAWLEFFEYNLPRDVWGSKFVAQRHQQTSNGQPIQVAA